MLTTGLLEKARLYVRRFFSKQMPKHLEFHDLEHTLAVARSVVEIGRASGLQPDTLLQVELAALFHDTGYAVAYDDHEKASTQVAGAWLSEQGVRAKTIEDLNRLILATRLNHVPNDLAEQVLQDANSAKAGQVDFHEWSERLHQEREAHLGVVIPPVQRARASLEYMEAHRFHTRYARQRYGRQKALNLVQLRLAADRSDGKGRSHAKRGQEPFMDRELSWLSFNARVLQEAQDRHVPLLERLKFVAIHSSNLDEFYRVRVAQLRALGKLGKWNRSALEVPPVKHIGHINQVASHQQAEVERLYGTELVPALRKQGIRLLQPGQLSATHRAFVLAFFKRDVAPLVTATPLDRAGQHFIEDRQLYLVFALVHKHRKQERLMLVNVPSDALGRFLVLPGTGTRTDLIFLDDVLRLGAGVLFKGWTVRSCHSIKLSRDADLYLDEEYSDDVVLKVRRSLRKRSTGVPARFLYPRAMPRKLLDKVRRSLGVKQQELLAGGRYHNLNDLMGLPVEGRPDLHDPPRPGLAHPVLEKRAGRPGPVRGDVLLQFPYHDFQGLVDLLEHAAKEPAVERIAITLYRVADRSRICRALVIAARQGKQVDVVMEVLARFDERNNLRWGAILSRAGARVRYGVADYKVHCKLLLIERRKDGSLAREAFLGTGNFNEKTARTYSDMGLLTSRKTITADVALIMDGLMRGHHPDRTKALITSPDQMRDRMEEAIDREIEQAVSGKPASILLKLNSLEDKPLIRKLYDASRAGVHVRLIVRGICCLVPGIQVHSSHIQAISIVDRYLEHIRAFVFHNGGKTQVYLSSADWMQRNMDRRVEAAFPVLDAKLKAEVLGFLEQQWSDNVKARLIDAEQTNHYRKPRRGAPRIRSQEQWYQLLAAGLQ